MRRKEMIEIEYAGTLSQDELALYHQQLLTLLDSSKRECAVVKLALAMKDKGIESGEGISGPIVIPLNEAKEINAFVTSIHIPELPANSYELAYCKWRIQLMVPRNPAVSKGAEAFINAMQVPTYSPIEQNILLADLPLSTLEEFAIAIQNS